MSDEVFLKLEGIKKSFGGVHALKGVDLEIRKGEIHCLAGENGCGKSTLIKAISGVHDADEGSIWIDGEKVEKMKPMDAINRGIQVIYQDFAVFPNLTVAENIALNGELKNKQKFVNWKSIHEIAAKAMAQVGADIDPDVKLERLSVANKQMVAICRAIINDAKLLILDEPTTALTAREVDKLWDIVRSLKAKGIAIMIVNHKLDEIYRIADRLTILRNGAYVSSGPISEYDQARFTRDMTGHDVSEDKYHPEEQKEEILRVENLSRKGAFENVSFTLHKGDVLGLTGLLGSGRGRDRRGPVRHRAGGERQDRPQRQGDHHQKRGRRHCQRYRLCAGGPPDPGPVHGPFHPGQHHRLLHPQIHEGRPPGRAGHGRRDAPLDR